MPGTMFGSTIQGIKDALRNSAGTLAPHRAADAGAAAKPGMATRGAGNFKHSRGTPAEAEAEASLAGLAVPPRESTRRHAPGSRTTLRPCGCGRVAQRPNGRSWHRL